jgi:AP-2 complex subunit alpha
VSRNYEGYEACIPRLVEILERLREKDVPQDYTYYGLPSPWLEVKVLRALQYFPAPENPEMLKRLREILKQILSVNDPVKNPNKNNAAHAIVFEAAAVAVSIEDEELTPLVVNLMVRFLTVRESNLKYLALENINRLSQSWQISKAISQHRKTIIACMSDADSSITGVALNLLFTTANKDTAGEIVEELLTAIERSDYSMREELVLKAAILAERFPHSPEWYVNVMLRLILCAGDASSNEIWHSILHLVSAKKELQAHAVEKVTKILQEDVANEVFLQCAAYIVGEYGRQSSMETMEQFNLLHQYYHSLSPEAKAMFLNCYEKMRCRSDADSELAKKIDDLMAYESKSIDPEVQQRAVEYSSLCSNHNIAEIALQTLPPWEMKKSVLLRKLVGNEGTSEEAREQPAWLDSSKEPNFDTEPPEPSEITDVHVDSTAAINDDSKEVSMEPQQPLQVLDLLDFGNDEPSEIPDEAINGSSIIGETQATVAEEVRQTSKTEPIEDIDAWLASLYTSMSGILYEDSNMQIGLKIRGKMSNLEIDFFVGNKTEGTLELKKFTIPPTPYFEVNCTEAPAEIEKSQQIMLQSTWACLLPYNTLPVLQIQYLTSGGESMARSLKLPTPVTKFCSPVTIPENVFITRWNQVSGAPFKLGKKKHCQSNPTAEQIAQILTMLNFEIIQVDLGQPNTSAVCIFHCESGQVKQIPCMASITASDVDPSEMTVTVATADATISEALMHALYTCLD